MISRITGLILGLTALLMPVHLPAAEMRARSILFLDQPEARAPFYYQADAAALALRVLNGGSSSDIPIKVTEVVKPIFNWRQMQRWGVSDSNLPPGSEICFLFVASVVLIQGALIWVLLQERKKRYDAELEAQHRMTELAHVNRQATAGELSSSIAHEINQPLGNILTNAETAEFILNSPSPDLSEMKEILADIRRDDLRASERSLIRSSRPSSKAWGSASLLRA